MYSYTYYRCILTAIDCKAAEGTYRIAPRGLAAHIDLQD